MRLWIGVVVSCMFIAGCFGNALADPKGYIVYCPCMGRFGNQVEHFLGTLAFARALDRVLVLPPFVEYESGKPHATMIDFTKYFSLRPFEKVHPVITMKKFMKEIAPEVWPPNERKVLCWNPHQSIFNKEATPGCFAKEGNPFGPFWDHSNIDFVGDIYFGHQVKGGFDISFKDTRKQWIEQFPASKFPVLAFSSAPAAFPAKEKDRSLQVHLRWAPSIAEKASTFIKENLERPFIGIHLRNDLDWDRVCEHVQAGSTTPLFGSAQCIGDYGEKGNLTNEMCAPSLTTILDDVELVARKLGAKSVFVSSDREHYIDELSERLSPLKVTVHRQNPDVAHVSLAILERADHFIGNCVSTYSSFVYRSRKYSKQGPLPTSFFGFHPEEIKRRKIEL